MIFSGKVFCFTKGCLIGLFAFLGVFLEAGNPSEIWMMRQDFVKFGKKEVYETAQKRYFEDFTQMLKKKEGFPVYAFQVLDSPEYFYLSPIKTYSGIDRMLQQKRVLSDSYPEKQWNIKMAEMASTINFFFKSVMQQLPDACSFFKGKEEIASFTHWHLYWVEIDPGQEGIFESHLEALAQEQKEAGAISWWVWRQTIGTALPKYCIGFCASSEDELEENIDQIRLIPAKYQQIVRKQTQVKALLRLDLSLR
ncbi:MAG: hypothetical protein HYZ48_01140 [Chlamydiales bacterium]|nr:hypothetical protein [Chlamydiales bacterium]